MGRSLSGQSTAVRPSRNELILIEAFQIIVQRNRRLAALRDALGRMGLSRFLSALGGSGDLDALSRPRGGGLDRLDPPLRLG